MALGERQDREALFTLWEAICETNHLQAIIDPCTYTARGACTILLGGAIGGAIALIALEALRQP